MKTDSLAARIAPILIALGLTACARPQPVEEARIEPGISQALAQQRAAKLSDIRYTLHLAIPAEQEADIPGDMSVEFTLKDTEQPLQLDFRESADHLRAVSVNGRDSQYRFESEHLVIPARELRAGANRIDIRFIAGNSSLNRNPDYLYTLFVPDRARTALPLFDQPDLKATWKLRLDLPADWTAMGNGAIDTVTETAGGKTVQFQRSDPIPSYLFAFVAGEFQSVTRTVDGREMTMLHREPDPERLQRNIDAIFELHAAALKWLEDYTGIPYPFAKFGFALIPAFQYGGMEHVGAIDYRADSLLLDEAPTETELLARATVIAHETAHMWFGDLVTMRWFDDVWTKEVFANFMAAKIVNPSFPEVNHALNFLVSHYPGAYSVDRTAGANPIRQQLPNLNEAGQLYGAIIYDKAPIMMRQLEAILGEDAFRDGLREYLENHAFGNASWPELIAVLDRRTPTDLAAWSEVWVNTAGRPEFTLASAPGQLTLEQRDPAGKGRLWPQRMDVMALAPGHIDTAPLRIDSAATPLDPNNAGADLLFNADGFGYGLFPASLATLGHWSELGELPRAALLVNLYEQMLEATGPAPMAYFEQLEQFAASEQNQLVLDLALYYLNRIYWTLLPDTQRNAQAKRLEDTLWQGMLASPEPGMRKLFFEAFSNVAVTPAAVQQLLEVWSGEREIDNLPLSERNRIQLSQLLAIKLPQQADAILQQQIAQTRNPDEVRRQQFLLPSLSPEQSVRDAFFESLKDERNRQTESWVLDALGNLHNPLRRQQSERYLLPSLELLQEIQVTGDIFFPKNWLTASLANYSSASAAKTVEDFLAARPDYNAQLRMKLLQAADPLLRARKIREKYGD